MAAFAGFMDNSLESYAKLKEQSGLRVEIEMGKLEEDLVLKRSKELKQFYQQEEEEEKD